MQIGELAKCTTLTVDAIPSARQTGGSGVRRSKCVLFLSAPRQKDRFRIILTQDNRDGIINENKTARVIRCCCSFS